MKQRNKLRQRLQDIFNDCVRMGIITEVPDCIVKRVRKDFIKSYSRFDARLSKINRNRVRVMYNNDGNVLVSCEYYNKAYSQVYKLEDVI